MPNILQYAEPRTISLASCIERFRKLDERYLKNIHKHSLCTINEKGVSVCNGDSGGPLAFDSGANTRIIVGIVSWSATGVSIILEILGQSPSDWSTFMILFADFSVEIALQTFLHEYIPSLTGFKNKWKCKAV